MNTGDPSLMLNNRISRGGTGLVQPAKSTTTQVVAKAAAGKFAISLNYGFEELSKDFSKSQKLLVTNHGSSTATFNIAIANQAGSPHTAFVSNGGIFGGPLSSVTVPAGGTVELFLTLNVPVATAGNSTAFREVAGLVTLTPASASDNNGVTLRVPYYLVPRALSNISTGLSKFNAAGNAVATIKNKGAITGDADFYAWGLEDRDEPGKAANDIRSVGVQAFPFTATEQLIVFAVNVGNRWSNAAVSEYDIDLDVNGDGGVDYTVVGVDQGAVQTGTFNGVMGCVRVQRAERRGEHRLPRDRTARQLDDPDRRPERTAVPGGRAVPERGQPAVPLLGRRVRPDRHRGPGRGRRDRALQRVVELDQPGWLPDGGARRHRDGADLDQRRRVGAHARPRPDDRDARQQVGNGRGADHQGHQVTATHP